MKWIDRLRSKGLEGKLIRFVAVVVFCMGIVFMAASYVRISYLRSLVNREEYKETELVREEYRDSITDFTEDSLLELITWASDKTDDEFWILEHDIYTLGAQVEDVFRAPENYKRVPVSPPLKENAGKYALQILYPDGKNEASPKTVEMMERLANLAPMMEEAIRNDGGYTLDLYISTPDGLAIVMDNRSEQKLDEDGNAKPYDASKRPWYEKAVETEELVFTGAADSFFYDLDEVMLGYPVYVDNRLVAVIEGSIELDVLKQKLSERNIGEDGFSILITDRGQLVCSTRTEGELKMRDDHNADIRLTVNPQLKDVINKGLSGKIGVEQVEVDGKSYFAAHAPVDTAGWTQISFVSEEKIMESPDQLMENVKRYSEETLSTLTGVFRKSVFIMAFIMIFFMIVSVVLVSCLARKRVEPVEEMTEAVRGFVGDDMSFEMKDVYRTGDEIQELAEAFEAMSLKIKEYVWDIVENTAEQERAAAEMKASSQIQNKMLPDTAPDFLNKREYDIYAKMVPAKNVGGDFYDFFYLDDDHLAITIGDVSGKGITAALFMALSKQMLQSQMAIHGGDVVAAITESNIRLCKESVDAMFVTVWLGIVTLSTGELNFVNGGHMYAALKRAGGKFVIEEDNHSVFVGGLEFANFGLNTLTLDKGDMLFLYTDGVTEAINSSDEFFGEDGLLRALNEDPDLPPEELDNLVRQRIAEFTEGMEQYDDITTLCFKKL